MIFFLFKPLDIKKQEFIDVPLLDIDKFTMYEFNLHGLQTVMLGKRTLRYADRYTVQDIDFTDHSKDYTSNMKAKKGVYKDDIVNLEGDVAYYREDGLAFEAKTLLYDTKTATAKTDDAFTAYEGLSTMQGRTLKYNADKNTIYSKNVLIKYKLNEGK